VSGRRNRARNDRRRVNGQAREAQRLAKLQAAPVRVSWRCPLCGESHPAASCPRGSSATTSTAARLVSDMDASA
jgi:hypothetical protein